MHFKARFRISLALNLSVVNLVVQYKYNLLPCGILFSSSTVKPKFCTNRFCTPEIHLKYEKELPSFAQNLISSKNRYLILNFTVPYPCVTFFFREGGISYYLSQAMSVRFRFDGLQRMKLFSSKSYINIE